MTSVPNLYIGTGYMGEQRGQPVTMNIKRLLTHCLAVGSTGSGKSVILKVLAEEMLVRGVPVVALDTMGDLAGLCVPAASGEVYQRFNLAAPSVGPDDWKVGSAYAESLRQVIEPRILTPFGHAGEWVSIPLFGTPPNNDQDGSENDPNGTMIEAQTIAVSLISRLGFKSDKASPISPDVIGEVLCRLWEEGVALDGAESIDDFVQGLRTYKDQYRICENDIAKFDAALSRFRFGVGALWLKGLPMNWSYLLSARSGRTPVVIIGLAHLEPDQRVAAVGAITSSLHKWCRLRGASPDRPRVALVVDELAGDGSEYPLLPIGTRKNYSGAALTRVLRQGRHCGLSLLCGSQSPGDCNYKAFSLFNTKFIGKLLSEADISKAFYSMSVSDSVRSSMISSVNRATNGHFVVHEGGPNYVGVKVRWLGSMHVNVTREVIDTLYQTGHCRRIHMPDSVRARNPAVVITDAINSIVKRYGDKMTPAVREHLINASILSRQTDVPAKAEKVAASGG